MQQQEKISWGRCVQPTTPNALPFNFALHPQSDRSGISSHSVQANWRTKTPSDKPFLFYLTLQVNQVSYIPNRLLIPYSPFKIDCLDMDSPQNRRVLARLMRSLDSIEAYIRWCSIMNFRDRSAGIFIGSFFGG